MKLEVERLTAEPRPFAYEEGSTWWSARMPRAARVPREVAEPFRVTGVVYRGAGSEDIILEPAGLRTPAEPEAAEALARNGMCLADEVELGWYRGAEIQLDSVCLEMISLALPVKPLCRDDCAGLCPRCGTDRNEAPCGCSETAPNSPFAVLAALRGETGAD